MVGLFVWLFGWGSDWLLWLVEWFVDWFIGLFSGWSFRLWTDRLRFWFVEWLLQVLIACCRFDRFLLVCWMECWLVFRLIGWLVFWLVSFGRPLVCWAVRWLTGWALELIGLVLFWRWYVGWFVPCLTHCVCNEMTGVLISVLVGWVGRRFFHNVSTSEAGS